MNEKNEDKDKRREKIRKKRGVNASDHSGWSSENSPWGGGSSSGRGTGPEGRGDGGGHSSRFHEKIQAKRQKEAKEKREKEAKEKLEAEEKAKREATIAKEQRARTVLKQASSLAIIGGAITPTGQIAPVFSVSGVGSMALTDAIGTSLLAELSSAINSLSTVAATASNVAFNALSRGFVVASIFHSPEVGKDSDLAHGRTLEQFLSLSVPAKTMVLNNNALKQAEKTSSGIAMSVRGKLAVTEKKVDINVVKTRISQSVRVVEAKFDKNTGLYSHAILDNKIGDINVVTAPIKESVLTGQPPLVTALPSVPVNIPNRGNSRESANSSPMPVSKTTPFHDVIVVYPEAAKMEPVYVMFEPKAQSIAEAARQHHAEPLTEKITEHKGLVRIKSRTPSKTGEGMKGRWLSSVDGAIYEWNSEIGKLEVVKSPHKSAEQSIKEAGKHHYPTPSTESLTDYQGLIESRAKTPVADGKGKKFRWTDATGKTLYEWNPLIGKMETYKAGHWDTQINRKAESVRVWVVESVIDQATGLYGITLPDEHGKQGRTVLISPIKAPGADGLGHLLHPEGRQIVILNTGENAAIKTPIVTVYPNPVQPDIDAEIAVPPLETNYPPLYVMFNKPRKGEKPAGHDYHQPPKTQDITGFSGLIKKNPKTPKQGGSGNRWRWVDAKGRTIYEWDYQHGELEGYRASDGEHLGSFDHKTGQQSKPAVPGRNIKKYL